MDEELVLLTSFFNLADGRRQDSADTFRVDEALPSATSPSGNAALYVVTESSASGQMGPRARRLATDTIAWEYSSHGEEPPAARLRAALRTAHEEVRREFDGHVTVGVTIIAVEEQMVYLGQVAPAQVYVLHEGRLHSVPAAAGGTSPFAYALGSTNGPRISVFRDEVGPNDVIALCTSWFHRAVDAEELRECFAAETAEAIAESLLEVAKQHDARNATAIVIEAVSAAELEAVSADGEYPGFLEQVDSAVQALADVGKLLLAELHPPQTTARAAPTEKTETPIVEPSARQARARSAPSEAEAAPTAKDGLDTGRTSEISRPETVVQQPYEAARRDQPTEEVPIVPDLAPADGAGPSIRGLDELMEAPPEPAVDEPTARRASGRASRPREPVSELDEINSRIREAPDLGDVIPPVQAFPDTSTEPERIYATNKDLQAANKRPRRFGNVNRPGSKVSVAGPPVIRPGLTTIDLSRPVGRPAPPAVIWLFIAGVGVLAVVAFVLFIRHHRPTAIVDPYPALAQKELRLAVAAKSPAQQDAHLNQAKTRISQAQRFGAPVTTIHKLNVRWQTTSDSLHHITHVANPVVLSNFGKFPGAQPSQIAAAPGLVVVLDGGRKGVFSIVPNSTSNPSQIVQAGETDSGFNIGLPQQIAVDGSTALVLDDHNVLVRSTGSTNTATSLAQPTQTAPKIVSMASADPDVYLLDTANSQVWRYPFAVSAYNPQPSAFFEPNTPNLAHSLAMALDSTDMYILQSDGSITKFDILHANPQKFAVHLRVPLGKPTEIFTEQGLNYLWVADPANNRIVQLDKSGGYIRTYTGSFLSQIKSFSIGPAGNTIYVLAGSKIFDFPVVH